MDFGLAWNPRSWEILDGVVASLRQETREKGAPLAIALFPVHIQVLGSYQDTIRRIAAAHSAPPAASPTWTSCPALRADWQARREKFFYDHCHYTPYGYTVVAREIVAGLDREKLIPK